jgi:glucokinase
MRNDGRCHAIAEVKYGAGINSKILAMITLGTGIGGALVVNGKLFDGSTFDAGDFGHHVIHNGGPLAFDCVCGKKGCFEYHASADGLVRHYTKLNGDKNITNAHEFMILLRQSPNDLLLKQAFHDYRNDLSTGLANIVTFYNPDTIIIGGGLSQAPELFDGLVDLVDSKTLVATRGNVKIVPAKLANNAGAIGAAIIAFQNYYDITK